MVIEKSDYAIEIQDLCKDFDEFQLEHITMKLPKGCILGLVGENGAGKSTTIKLIMNALKAKSGSVKVLGVDNQSKEFDQLKNQIGVVLDEAYYPEILNAKQVGIIMKDTYENWNTALYEKYMKHFRITMNKPFKDYSRGMKMKLAIAVALCHDPKLLILDEATSGLDPLIRDEILDMFNEFTREESHSILLSSHIVSDLEKICDYIAFIHNGKLLFCEEKDRILEKFSVIKCSKEDFEAIPASAIVGKKETPFGYEALVENTKVNDSMPKERTTLEDIILYHARGGRN